MNNRDFEQNIKRVVEPHVTVEKGLLESASLGRQIAKAENEDEYWKKIIEWMHKDKAFLLDEISRCHAVEKDAWYEYLGNIYLANPDAEVKLKVLLGKIEAYKSLQISPGQCLLNNISVETLERSLELIESSLHLLISRLKCLKTFQV